MAQKKYIQVAKLKKTIKKFFHKLVLNGQHLVNVIDFNAELQKVIDSTPTADAVEWNAVDEIGLPLVSDEYLVMIAGAVKPTVLFFDEEDGVFLEERIDLEDDVTYEVTHWAEMPGGPANV
jgi:hypothetical protein